MQALWIIPVIILAGGMIWFLVPHLYRKLAERRLLARCRRDRTVVLSYDDGPGPDLTNRLLDLLDQHNAKATFFLIGRRAEADPATVRRMIDAGHQVASHTFDHSNAWKSDPFTAALDLSRGRHAVQALGGDGRVYRPPYGKITLGTLLHAVLGRIRFGWWTLDSGDTWSRLPDGPEEVLNALRKTLGGVVLMHDFDRVGAENDPSARADYVLNLTRAILEAAQREGWTVSRLDTVAEW